MDAPGSPLILLVDDFDDAREMYAAYFALEGFNAVTARSADEAIALALKERPAVILMDLEMGGTSGTTAMQRLREDSAFTGVPIIAFTAHAMEKEHDRAIRDGFDAVITKPCTPDDLVALLAPYLASGRCAAT